MCKNMFPVCVTRFLVSPSLSHTNTHTYCLSVSTLSVSALKEFLEKFNEQPAFELDDLVEQEQNIEQQKIEEEVCQY